MADILRSRRGAGGFVARLAVLLLLSLALSVRPVLAQEMLRDAETEALLHDAAAPLMTAAGLRPGNVQIVLLQDRTINAFVAGGQIVYIQSGLIEAANNVNEVQGVIAHELGHVTGGHVIRMAEGAKAATGIMILSLLLGAAAMAAGSGEAGAGIMAAGQQAAMGKFLAFTRVQENSADQAGASFLIKAGITGKGIISFFQTLQNQEYRYAIPQKDSYGQTHPLTSERIAALEHVLKNAPSWNNPVDPKLEERFQLVKAKLSGYVNDPQATFYKFPESNKSLPARYARAYAWHKKAYPDKADAEVEELIKARPDYPYFYELKGQILLESGKPLEALDSLRTAVRLAPDQPLIASLFGHALIESGKEGSMEEAKKVLRSAVARDNDNPFAWYQLGIVYDHEGDNARASLATAERYNLEGNARLAMISAEQAMRGISMGTPDWIRAQDIAMVSRTEVEKDRKKR